MIYLDNSATTRQYDEVTKRIYEISMEEFGNPSSLHSLGFAANSILTQSRNSLKECFKAGGEVIFTSGGTESDNMALFAACRKMRRRGKRVITTAVEHPAVLEVTKRLGEDGFEIVVLPCDNTGCVSPQDLRAALSTDTIIVSIMTVNNEVGTIEPVLESYKYVQEFNKEHGTSILFHSDAVQAFGKLSLREAPFDLISISGHKFHGPKGIGAIYIGNGVKLEPYIYGGGQEFAMRSGTENLPGIAGMALAAEMSGGANLQAHMTHMAEVNEYLRNGLMSEIQGVRLNGPIALGDTLDAAGARCPSVLNMSFEGTRGEVLLHTLEQDGIMVSTGSACASHHTGDSHVLLSMGLNHKQIEGAIRFSLSEFNTIEEMDIVIDRVKAAVMRFRKLGSFR